MKKILLALLPLFVLTSCIKGGSEFYLSDYMAVVNVIDAQTLKSDEGLTFNVTQITCDNGYAQYPRIVIICDITGKDESGMVFDVKLKSYENVPVKTPVIQSAPGSAVIGNDAVCVKYGWYSGKMLTLQYHYTALKESSTKHIVNLVFNDEDSDSENILLRLVHDGFGETYSNEDYEASRFELVTETVSFDLSSILPAGRNKVTSSLDYIWYEEDESGYLYRTTKIFTGVEVLNY